MQVVLGKWFPLNICYNSYTYVYMYIYIYTHTHVYIYIYIYIYVCTPPLGVRSGVLAGPPEPLPATAASQCNAIVIISNDNNMYYQVLLLFLLL